MNIKSYFNKNNLLICLLIAICFLWTGSGYLSWMYHLLNFYSAPQVDLLTEVIGYIFQAAGLFLFAFFQKKSNICSNSALNVLIPVIDFLLMIPALIIPSPIAALFFGYLMNLFHGLVAGLYLTILSRLVPVKFAGITFGLAYALGSLGSYILSAIGKGNFLQNPYILFLYGIMISVTIGLISVIKSLATSDEIEKREFGKPEKLTAFVLFACIVVLLLSLTKNIGFYFPMSDLGDSSISLEFTRLFYAIGLVIAGLINDQSRKWGAIICIASLIFPFAMMLLNGQVDSRAVLWLISYFFFAFFVVFRVVLFVDISVDNNMLYLAGLGLMWGRVGDAVGAGLGMLLQNMVPALVLISSLLFIATVILFFLFYDKYYKAPVASKEEQISFNELGARFDFTAREMEVLKLMLEGSSNSKIAEELFISESTVKFHVKNILKKTNCKNRKELGTFLLS